MDGVFPLVERLLILYVESCRDPARQTEEPNQIPQMKIISSTLALAILTFSACKQEPVEGRKEPGEKDGKAYLLQVGDEIEM